MIDVHYPINRVAPNPDIKKYDMFTTELSKPCRLVQDLRNMPKRYVIEGHYHEKKEEFFSVKDGKLRLKREAIKSDEYFNILEGDFLLIDKGERASDIVHKGDMFYIPPFMAHTFIVLSKFATMSSYSPQNKKEVEGDLVKYEFKW